MKVNQRLAILKEWHKKFIALTGGVDTKNLSTPSDGMYPLAEQVEFTKDELVVWLVDGRTVTIPLVWFPRLASATTEQLHKYEILGDGEGIHWPDIDEDLNVEGLLLGTH